MQDRSAGITQRKEDDVNLMSGEDFCDYLNDNYISKDGHKIIYREDTKNIFMSILKKFTSVSFSITYNYKSNIITMNDEVESFCPKLCKKIKENFKIDKEYVNTNYTKFIISPSDGSECTNRFFVDVINFIIENGDENMLLMKKKHINESIWSDMQDRSAGDTVREEDMITTNENLRNKILELYKEQGEGETLDVSSLTNAIKCDDFTSIFQGYVKVKHIIGIEDWDVSSVKDMKFMFQDCYNFNSDLSKWDVSNVKSMTCMFTRCTNFNSDLSKWDVSEVTNMGGMLQDCENFNSDLSNWDVSKVTDMGGMFLNCYKFNSDLSNWNVSKVGYMRYMFQDCYNFNSDLSKWDVSNVKSMTCMFRGCQTFNSDLSNWNVNKVTNMGGMFNECESLKQIPFWYKN